MRANLYTMHEDGLYQPTTLIDVLWQRTALWQEALLLVIASGWVALMAQIEIPLWPVPITGQTFGVLLVGAALGSRRGALSLILYLTEGALGLPVFAGGAAGISRIAGPTGGYLIGFVAAAFVIGWLCERGWDRHFLTMALAMLTGNLVIYLFGIPWLAQFTGWEKVWAAGLLPFLPGDLLKWIFAALVFPWVRSWGEARRR